jgi:2Fe-2S ferredoxin
MPKIIFNDQQGQTQEVDVKAGLTVMEAAVDNNVAGIVAECGGACACATCHVYIDESWLAKLPAMDDMEDAMLDAALDRRSSSRLSCQIEMTDELDGLVVTPGDNEV